MKLHSIVADIHIPESALPRHDVLGKLAQMTMTANGLRYIARQAILDTNQKTVGYELLYRDGPQAIASFEDTDVASMQTLDSSLLFGVDTLCGEALAFINCSAHTLLSDYINVIPPTKAVLEILEDVPATPEILEACKRLSNANYTLALDDFIPTPANAAFIPYAKILKVDFRATTHDERVKIVKKFGGSVTLLAEKVETQEEYEEALKLHFSLFQGFYFCKPALLCRRDASPSRMAYIRLIEAIANESMDLSKLEDIIKSDAALCFRLLRYLNSAVFCLQSGVSSIRHALALLGEREIRRWVMLTAVAQAADGKPVELVRNAMIRAKVGELLAPKAKCKAYDAFLVGLFSLMDAVLDLPLSELVTKVELPPAVNAALCGVDGRLLQLLDLVRNNEVGDWDNCELIGSKLGIDEPGLTHAYLESLKWVEQLSV